MKSAIEAFNPDDQRKAAEECDFATMQMENSQTAEKQQQQQQQEKRRRRERR